MKKTLLHRREWEQFTAGDCGKQDSLAEQDRGSRRECVGGCGEVEYTWNGNETAYLQILQCPHPHPHPLKYILSGHSGTNLHFKNGAAENRKRLKISAQMSKNVQVQEATARPKYLQSWFSPTAQWKSC